MRDDDAPLRRCACGAGLDGFTSAVLHRMASHDDSPANARQYATEIMENNVIPLVRRHDKR